MPVIYRENRPGKRTLLMAVSEFVRGVANKPLGI
jgi:hypothetical protein